MPWWEHLGRGELHACAIKDCDSLVGFAPFYFCESTLRLLGTGISDYLDVLCRPGCGRALLAAIDRLAEFRQLRPCSPLFSQECEPDEPCPVLNFSAIPKHMTQNTHYYRRRAEREGSITWDTASHANVPNLLSALIDLHTASWENRGACGVLDHLRIRAFHHTVAPRLFKTGLLRMYGLRLGNRLIGVWYGFFHQRRLYFYLSGFSPDHQHLSPGTLLIAHAIECALNEGGTCLDFLRGEEPYKFLWGARSQATYRRLLRPGQSLDWTQSTSDAILSQ